MTGILKIGRIGKKIEEAMGVSIANDPSIYVLDLTLDDLARRYPESYLSILSEVKEAIKKPDSFSFDIEHGVLMFFRLIPKGKELFLLIAKVSSKGSPRKFVLSSISATKDLSFPKLKEGGPFYRV